MISNSRPSASNYKSFSWSLEQIFLTVSQNNFGNKIPLALNALQSFYKKYFSALFSKKHIYYCFWDLVFLTFWLCWKISLSKRIKNPIWVLWNILKKESQSKKKSCKMFKKVFIFFILNMSLLWNSFFKMFHNTHLWIWSIKKRS